MSRKNKYNKDLDHDTDIIQSAKPILMFNKNPTIQIFHYCSSLFYLNYNQKYLQKRVCHAYISLSPLDRAQIHTVASMQSVRFQRYQY